MPWRPTVPGRWCRQSPQWTCSPDCSQAELLEAFLDLFEVEIERAKLVEFAFGEMFRHLGIAQQLLFEVCVGRARVLGLPGLHRATLHQVISLLARQAFLDQCEQ